MASHSTYRASSSGATELATPAVASPPAPGEARQATPPATLAPAVPPATAFGPQGAEPAVVVPDRDYLDRLMTWLEQHKDYPPGARDQDAQGVVLVSFVIDRDGHLRSFDLRRSSGNRLLDAAARATIERSDPMPPLPRSYAGGELRLTLPVTFRLR